MNRLRQTEATVTVGEETVDSSIPFAAEGGIRKV